jgi:hypothetical protein
MVKDAFRIASIRVDMLKAGMVVIRTSFTNTSSPEDKNVLALVMASGITIVTPSVIGSVIPGFAL